MSRPLFRPSAQQVLWLVATALISGGYAYHVRYHLIEQPGVALACAAGDTNWSCLVRGTAIALFTPQAFGTTALIAALINLIRPSIVPCALALVCAGFGLMLYNVALAALAVALLILSLARPAPVQG